MVHDFVRPSTLRERNNSIDYILKWRRKVSRPPWHETKTTEFVRIVSPHSQEKEGSYLGFRTFQPTTTGIKGMSVFLLYIKGKKAVEEGGKKSSLTPFRSRWRSKLDTT